MIDNPYAYCMTLMLEYLVSINKKHKCPIGWESSKEERDRIRHQKNNSEYE